MSSKCRVYKVSFRSCPLPVPHRTEIVSQHAERHRPARGMMREIRHVALNLSVQVDAPVLKELQQRHTRERPCDAGDAERHLRIGLSSVLQAGESSGFAKHRAAVVVDADRDRGVPLPPLNLRHHSPKGGDGIGTRGQRAARNGHVCLEAARNGLASGYTRQAPPRQPEEWGAGKVSCVLVGAE